MKCKLKAPGTERLKLKHDNLLSKFAFKFNLRRYMMVWCDLHGVVLKQLGRAATG
jgi:hypothetical protein